MKIENEPNDLNIPFKITNIEGDMGEPITMFLIQQGDGDVIIGFSDPSGNIIKHCLISMEFCTNNGGGRYPIIAKKLRELIAELLKQDNPGGKGC